ncbi:O-antigen translocase [Proteus faecis]|uniref:O-antigen translocase n=1 Tax=Proteus faecis TaxID=2050967 RepID=A0AAW7CN38_9GAMM|nr:O-antigen translocase [Proteus faecis]MDL5167693.1 O-antigen translocase [Proteus faecis]MDL5275678.1 O-antigen translocase [Proteus faecis]MDL5279091.1 O-antigen translocase [Proteus faecis]MDL5308093.1 O-antigen translocase [Proteus faecis]MDL5311809.1 O-antigen translocase [Proteus faecis]
MTLIKTSILSLIATFFKMLSGLVINKAISIYIGPSGLALMGQFQNFIQIVLSMAQGGINNGIVKYTAEHSYNDDELGNLFSTGLKISLLTSIIIALFLILFSYQFSIFVLDNDNYFYLFITLGCTIILFVINNLLLSILNGLKEIKTFIKINIIQSIYSLVFTSIFIISFGITGALLALATNQSVIFFISLYFIKKNNLLKFNLFQKKFDKKTALNLLKFSEMAIVALIATPLSQFIIRKYITINISLTEAGIWQGMSYISTTYLFIITTALGIYYLPRLSELMDISSLKKEIIKGYIIIIPMIIFIGSLIFGLKDIIIQLLFSKDFFPMRNFFIYQILGDIIKIMGWLLSYIMLAKAMTKYFIISEIIFFISYTSLSILFINQSGTIGAIYAYITSYILYFFFVFFIINKKLRFITL